MSRPRDIGNDGLKSGNVMVKYDMEVCGVYDNLVDALKAIRTHHFVERDPAEAKYFEFFLVTGPAGVHLDSTRGTGWHDEHGHRVINGYAVQELGHLLE